MSMAFTGLWRQITVIEYGPDQIIKGERVRGPSTEFIVPLVVLRITPSQMRNLPEGKYSTGDIQIYGRSNSGLEQGQVIRHKGDLYRIEDILDREFEGGFFKALAKREI